MSENTPLLPCPFCGKDAVLEEREDDVWDCRNPSKFFHAYCTSDEDCLGTCSGFYGYDTEEEAVELWNKRATSEVGKLKDELNSLKKKYEEAYGVFGGLSFANYKENQK